MYVNYNRPNKESRSQRAGKLGGFMQAALTGRRKLLSRQVEPEPEPAKSYAVCQCVVRVFDGKRYLTGSPDCPKHFDLSGENPAFNRIRPDYSPAKRHRGTYTAE